MGGARQNGWEKEEEKGRKIGRSGEKQGGERLGKREGDVACALHRGTLQCIALEGLSAAAPSPTPPALPSPSYLWHPQQAWRSSPSREASATKDESGIARSLSRPGLCRSPSKGEGIPSLLGEVPREPSPLPVFGIRYEGRYLAYCGEVRRGRRADASHNTEPITREVNVGPITREDDTGYIAW